MLRIDLNCDMGEGIGNESDLMPHITSANIACGAHAGDAALMRSTLVLAATHGVAAGAHPGYPDPENFGRLSLGLAPREIYDTVAAQVGELMRIAGSVGVRVTHVKPHGALYNDAARNANVARSFARAVHDMDRDLLLYALAGSVLMTEAEQIGLRVIGEAFADRAYARDGSLVDRATPSALITDAAEAAARVLRMVATGRVRAHDGTDHAVRADTICIHGDGPTAVDVAREVRRALDTAGIRVQAPAS